MATLTLCPKCHSVDISFVPLGHITSVHCTKCGRYGTAEDWQRIQELEAKLDEIALDDASLYGRKPK